VRDERQYEHFLLCEVQINEKCAALIRKYDYWINITVWLPREHILLATDLMAITD
jgi:hypothetical protein